ncbi:MAG: TPM domain-containing protein [Clostridiaceae bacterium]|jgi:uncharacterized protein|nr:TPM domain-containing protein [Clostridiaceae bacterium]
MKKVILGLFLLIFTLICLPVQALEDLNFQSGFISDNAKVINQQDYEAMNKFLWELHNKTTADIAVVTVTSLQGEDVKDVAIQIGNKYKVGAKGKNNGAVLLVAPNERKARIEVAPGLMNVLPESVDEDIMDNTMIPFFKSGDYSKGIYSGAAKMTTIIANSYNVQLTTLDATTIPQGQNNGARNGNDGAIPFWAWPFIIIGGLFSGRRRYGAFGGGGGFGGGCGSSGSW